MRGGDSRLQRFSQLDGIHQQIKYEYPKYAEFHADFKSVEIIAILWRKSHISIFLTLQSPIRKKRLKILKKVFYKSFLELATLYTFIPVNP